MSFVSASLKWCKYFVTVSIALLVAWFALSFTTKLLFSKKNQFAQVAHATDFAETDLVQYSPKQSQVTQLESDRTLDALLSGMHGPCVVMVYAEWCSHCRNMMEAYEVAAKTSAIPFVRIEGMKAPVSSTKYGITGYPTVFGVASVGGPPRRFGGMRTPDMLLEFAKALGNGPVLHTEPMQQQMQYPALQVQPSVAQPVAQVPMALASVQQTVSQVVVQPEASNAWPTQDPQSALNIIPVKPVLLDSSVQEVLGA